jgi:hypothetical protein
LFDWWLVLICFEIKVLLIGCCWLVCSKRGWWLISQMNRAMSLEKQSARGDDQVRGCRCGIRVGGVLIILTRLRAGGGGPEYICFAAGSDLLSKQFPW